MEKIKRLWFDEDFIHMESSEKRKYKLPLTGSSRLRDATEEQRENYSIELGGTAVRWEDIDEDIFITAFYDHKDGSQNRIANLFFKYPMLSVAGVAKMLGISKTLMYKYIYGLKSPSESREQEIFTACRSLGQQLIQL